MTIALLYHCHGARLQKIKTEGLLAIRPEVRRDTTREEDLDPYEPVGILAVLNTTGVSFTILYTEVILHRTQPEHSRNCYLF
jgi:hypothetical protein